MRTALPALALLLAAAPARAGDGGFAALADALLSSGPFSGASVGALFVDLDSGATAFARGAEAPLIPASTAKLATTAAALDALGPAFRFRTALLGLKRERGRTARSALVWRGDGDPSISGRGRASRDEIFGLWGESLRKAGIARVGRLVLDGRAFAGPATPPGWPAEELSYWYQAETSAIAYNDDCVDLRFEPGAAPGRPARVSLDPDFGYVRVRNRAVTGPPGSAFTLDYRRAPAGNDVEFFGSIAADSPPRTDYVAVHEPARFAALALARAWGAAGPRVERAPRDWRRAGLREDELEELVSWTSEPLARLAKTINASSQNFWAEQLLKALGLRTGGRGGFDEGLAAVRAWLARAGIEGVRLVDGSGLSEDDRLSAAALVRVLRAVRTEPWFEAYRDSLAVPGVDRAARDRMKGEPLAGRMRLKRGTVKRARNLAGYLESRGGRRYAFAVLVNGDGLDRAAVDAALDRLCVEAARRLP